MVPLKKFDLLPLFFFVPAFKINPRAFLQIASQMTILQNKFADILPGLDQGSTMKPVALEHNYPVTLERAEAIQALKSVLAGMTVDKRNGLPRLPHLELHVKNVRLLYLPFIRQRHDCVQEQTGATILTAALKHGRFL
jgi:hypothetical protein